MRYPVKRLRNSRIRQSVIFIRAMLGLFLVIALYPSVMNGDSRVNGIEHAHTNRLSGETSPYLQQHAHNPVDWFPWSDEAFEKARREGKPIFLSIGYSSCHWCHVMERESFENEQIAAYLNEHFVSIKVDREERPDIDRIYMDAVYSMTGSGGWPLSVFLTPERKPFFGGTYFPPEDRYGRPGFLTVLENVQHVWLTKRDDVSDTAEQIADAISKENTAAPSDSLAGNVLRTLSSQLSSAFDKKYGGFGMAPKFPPSSALSLLLRQYFYTEDKSFLAMAEKTLRSMARGGMYDQIGGGFHRYSTDARWLVPHFEKMLYDNAQLAIVYYEAFQTTGDSFYRRVADETLSYVLRDMTDSTGGFHSAEDADSEGEEGKFYVWTPEEISAVLKPDLVSLATAYYNITDKGIFEGGTSIAHVAISDEEFADANGLSEAQWNAKLQIIRASLLAERSNRVRPLKDDKILVAWNGLMMSAFCKGYQVTGNQNYLHAAKKAAEFILTSMRSEDGGLLRSYRSGQAKIAAFIDDYAFFTTGLIDLYESDFDRKWLAAAEELSQEMTALFWDEDNAAFFFHSGHDETVLNRTKMFHDGAIPSGNAVAIQTVERLAVLLGKEAYREKAYRALLSISGRLDKSPRGFEQSTAAMDFFVHPPPEIAIVGHADASDTKALIHIAHTTYLPARVVAWREPDSPMSLPLLDGKTMFDGKATAYVCQNYTCKAPVTKPDALSASLSRFYSKPKSDSGKNSIIESSIGSGFFQTLPLVGLLGIGSLLIFAISVFLFKT